MAYLYYGADLAPIEIPETLLAHLKIVITAKLRRRESFLMSWRHEDGSGRSSIWLQPSIPLRFVFENPEPAELDRELLARLAESAHSNGGLAFTIPGSAASDEKDEKGDPEDPARELAGAGRAR